MQFTGFDGKNEICGEISGLQHQFRHLVPNLKYSNSRNHRLAMKLVHLLPKNKLLMDVNNLETNGIFHCKGFSIWGSTNSCRGKNLKLLKTAQTK